MEIFTPYLLGAMGIIAIISLCFSMLVIYLQLKKHGFSGDTRAILVVNLRMPIGTETRLHETRVKSPEEAQFILDQYMTHLVLSAHVFDPVDDTVIATMDKNGHLRPTR